jgi:hypothetical protein
VADAISRPTFYEGQFIAADDLNGVVRQAAGWQGRHGRLLHSWGIASGLALDSAPKKTAAGADYVDVTLKIGMAIDGFGYEIVVAADTLINPALFDQSSVATDDPDAFYPVLLAGTDRVVPPAATGGSCTSSQSTRTAEGFQIEFDGPGQQASVEQQLPPQDFSTGPGTTAARPTWKILLGYVQWSDAIRRFTKVSMDPIDGVGRRYAGVRAGEVIAPAGEVIVRTHERDVAQKTVVVVTSEGDDSLVVGRQDGAGGVTRLLTVTRAGDVKAAGVISGAVTVGTHVQSGTAADGALLPLPPGIELASIESGAAQLHVHVTPRFSWKDPPPDLDDERIPLVEHCYVDDALRVRCQVRWAKPNLTDYQARPGVVDYTVIVSVQEKAS